MTHASVQDWHTFLLGQVAWRTEQDSIHTVGMPSGTQQRTGRHGFVLTRNISSPVVAYLI